jgi:quinolinate synthase
MYQQPLPPHFKNLSTADLIQRVQESKQRLGSDLVILTHHYQRPEVVDIGHIRGDSLQLAQFAATQTAAKYIVFCGVHFMAESADILKTGTQTVILPDLGAGCDLADAADAEDVEMAWEELAQAVGHEDIMPITYVNSTAALKAFVGKKGGIVCTSSNAMRIVDWALKERKIVFFYPDEHLGRNTSKKLGIPLSQMALWNPKKALGGLSKDTLLHTQVLLWQGCCPVHQMFTSKQIDKLRQEEPDIKILVHPECSMEVVDKSDLNLVNRIAKEHPDKKIVSLNPFMCLCGTMNRIDLPHLAWALEEIEKGTPQNVITVDEPIRSWAKTALIRMLELR